MRPVSSSIVSPVQSKPWPRRDGAAHGGAAVSADHDRRVRLLQRLGVGADVLEVDELAVEAGRAGAGPQLLDRAQVLVGDGAATGEVLGRQVERRELLLHPAQPRTEGEPAAGEVVRRRQHLREHHGVTQRDDQHALVEDHVLRAHRERVEQRQRLVDRVLPARRAAAVGVGVVVADLRRQHDVVAHYERVVAERVGGLADLDAALDADTLAEVADVGDGDAELHGPNLTCRVTARTLHADLAALERLDGGAQAVARDAAVHPRAPRGSRDWWSFRQVRPKRIAPLPHQRENLMGREPLFGHSLLYVLKRGRGLSCRRKELGPK